tara:strand:+ start:1510 stop:1701 length:192 start_codon:yes stop_codon:yes gene_type:complete
MPIKLRPSSKSYDRQTKKTTVKHYYIKSISNSELLSLYNEERTKPKLKQKILNELTRRRNENI